MRMQVWLPGSKTPFSPSIMQVRACALASGAGAGVRVGNSAAKAAEAVKAHIASRTALNLIGHSCVAAASLGVSRASDNPGNARIDDGAAACDSADRA